MDKLKLIIVNKYNDYLIFDNKIGALENGGFDIFKDVFKCFYKHNNANVEFKHNIVYPFRLQISRRSVIDLKNRTLLQPHLYSWNLFLLRIRPVSSD